MGCFVRRPAMASVTLVAAAGLAVGGCGSTSSPSAAGCVATGVQPAASGAAAGWTLPGGNLQNTRDVASAITGSNVSTLGVAWCVPIESTGATGAAGFSDGYATTLIVVNGVVYTQDLESNVMAIELATGKVLWTHDYNSLNGGPDGVNVVGGTVYAATDSAAVALSAATGRQLWSRRLIGNDHEGIDMAPGQTGKLLWKLPVGVHSGPGDAGLITENATPTSPIPLPAKFSLEPGVFGGIESQLATNGSTTFAAVNNLAVPMSEKGGTESSKAFEAAIPKATGKMIAVNQDTGRSNGTTSSPPRPTAPPQSPTTSSSRPPT